MRSCKRRVPGPFAYRTHEVVDVKLLAAVASDQRIQGFVGRRHACFKLRGKWTSQTEDDEGQGENHREPINSPCCPCVVLRENRYQDFESQVRKDENGHGYERELGKRLGDLLD